jgi:hypothetical protein
MATIEKLTFSGSLDGSPIKVTATTSGSANPIHTTTNDDTIVDEMWVYANNTSTSPATLTLQFGGTTNPDDRIVFGITGGTGLFICIPGIPLKSTSSTAKTLSAFSGTANVINIVGYVNRITP